MRTGQALLFHYNPYFDRWSYWYELPLGSYWTYASFCRKGGEKKDEFLRQCHLALSERR